MSNSKHFLEDIPLVPEVDIAMVTIPVQYHRLILIANIVFVIGTTLYFFGAIEYAMAQWRRYRNPNPRARPIVPPGSDIKKENTDHLNFSHFDDAPASKPAAAAQKPEPPRAIEPAPTAPPPPSTASIRELLFSRVRHGRYEAVQEMLSVGLVGDVNIRDEWGNTALHVAAQNGQRRMAKLLVKSGADVNALNFRGASPLHYSSTFGYHEFSQWLQLHGGLLLSPVLPTQESAREASSETATTTTPSRSPVLPASSDSSTDPALPPPSPPRPKPTVAIPPLRLPPQATAVARRAKRPTRRRQRRSPSSGESE